MSRFSAASQPRLRAGCRLSQTPQQGDVLLIPEGVLRLAGPGRKIVERCDGSRNVADIIRELQAEFASTDPARIESEVHIFLERLHQKGVVELA